MTGKHSQGTLDVSGIGRISVAPDEATVNLATITEAQTASEAVASNAEITQAVIDAVSTLSNHGFTTSGLGVSPMIEYGTVGHGKIVGYRATNNVAVKTKIGYAAQIFDAGIRAGANESSGISFGLRDETPVREDALRLAVISAFNEARIVSKCAEVQLDGPETISIEPEGGRVMYMTESLDRSAKATPVIPTDMTITATVRMVFRTKP
jgi:uncharacterized protein YggE